MRRLPSIALLLPSLAAANNLIGMGVGGPSDYDHWRMYADIARVMRVIGDSSNADIPAEDPRIDSTGMPKLTDFYFKMVFDPAGMDGRYRIRLGGKVTGIGASEGAIAPTDAAGADVGTWAAAYDGTYTYARYDEPNTTGSAISLHVQGAYRDAAGTQPGVASFSMMRPLVPGSTTSYAFGTLFTNEALAFAHHFDVLRWLDFTFTVNSQVQNWTDRGDPRYVSQAYQPGIAQVGGNPSLNIWGTPRRPGAYEDIIRFSNAAGVDAWINVPLWATGDDFYLKLAQLFKCGSDGMNPWIQADGVTCGTGTPPFPPLDSARKLYVEYSNEVWNFGFSQWTDAQQRIGPSFPDTSPIWYLEAPIAAWSSGTTYAKDALVRYSDGRAYKSQQDSNVGVTPGTDTAWWLPSSEPYRLVPTQIARISLAFRRVFGDAAMMTRIRPVLAGQAAWSNGPQGAANGLAFLFDYLSNGRGNYLPSANWTVPGTSTQVGPQPISYYLWGAGGAAYYTAASSAVTVSDLLTSSEFDPAYWSSGGELKDTAFPPVYGLPRVAYEGGPNYGDSGLATGDPRTNAGIARYTGRPNSPNMTDVMEAHHDQWSSLGGGLLTYYTSRSSWDYGGYLGGPANRSDGIYSFDGVPQMVAVDELRARAPAAITAGEPIPGTRQGNGYVLNVRDNDWTTTPGANNGATTLSATGTRFAGYLYRAGSSYTASTVILSKTGTGTAQVYLDGAALSTVDGGTTWTGPALSPGLHGVIVRASSGSVTVSSVAMDATAQPGALTCPIAPSPSLLTASLISSAPSPSRCRGVVLTTAPPGGGGTLTTVTYSEATGAINTNPERGWYEEWDLVQPDWTQSSANAARANGHTIVHALVYVFNSGRTVSYYNAALPQTFLDALTTGLGYARTAGLKVVLRFAYNWDAAGQHEADSKTRILNHITQIGPIVTANADVIMQWQAGFLGPWGEWGGGANVTNTWTATDRADVALAQLAAAPSWMAITVRKPVHKYEILGQSTAWANPLPVTVTSATAFGGTTAARVGFHNDCFAYNDSNGATFTWSGQSLDTTLDPVKTFLGAETQWVPMAGEDCAMPPIASSYHPGLAAECPYAEADLARMHWTFGKFNYYQGSGKVWTDAVTYPTGPCDTRINDRLGYRFFLASATFPTTIVSGATMALSFDVANRGYAAVINPRPVFAVLAGGSGTYMIPLSGVDPRLWTPGATTTVSTSVSLAGVPAGTYTLSLWLPDNATGLRSDPRYSIQFANVAPMWDSVSGRNNLGTVSVSG